MSAIQSLYTIAIALCLFSTALIASKNSFGSRRPSYFIRYLGLETLCFAYELLIAHPATPLKALWLAMLMGTSLLIAPCLWLAIKERTDADGASLASLNWIERAAIVIGALLTVPLLETTHWGPAFDDATETTLFFGGAIHATMLICVGIFVVQVPFYLWRSRRALASGSAPRWMQIPLIVVGTTWFLGIARTLMVALSEETRGFHITVALIDVAVTVACVYWITKHAGDFNVAGADARLAPGPADKAKYAKSQLDDTIRRRIVRKIERAFKEEHVFTDPNLSLPALSERLKESEHYVSQVLNQDLQSSFYDLVSTHRIARAKDLLIESSDRTILDIALTVGFNAKSTFNTAFRRATGMTPSEYRAARDALPGTNGASGSSRSDGTSLAPTAGDS
jgi:AraC-like DNA-binding protein